MDTLDQSESRKYELGYLLSPYIPADSLAETVEAEVFSHISKLGGEVTKTVDPAMRPLAYQIKKRIGHKQNSYRDAYFGTAFFTLPADKAPVLNDLLQKSELIIRFLLIIEPKYGTGKKRSTGRPTPAKPVEKTDETPAVKTDVDTKEIDKEIEDLLTTA